MAPMSLELWSAVASVGTFLVIGATAIAAIVQLRHLRSANQVAAWQMFAQTYEGPELRDAFHFVRTELAQRLEDPEFRRELRAGETDRVKHPEIKICNFFDQWGAYYRNGVIDRRTFMQVNCGIVIGFWELLEPVIVLLADRRKGNMSFQQFEYLTVQARRWDQRHPDGDFPKSEERIPLNDKWREVDIDRVPTAPPS